MTVIKSHTDIPQSKKLAEFLPIETADMYWYIAIKGNPKAMLNEGYNKYGDFELPCWSLAALLEQIPYELCDDDGNSSYLQMNKDDDLYQLVYEDRYGDFESIETDSYEHFVDACVEMIEKLNELNLL